MNSQNTKIDDCDGCAKQDVEVWSLDNMLLCNDCRKKQLDAKAEAARVPVAVESLIQKSQKQDASIQVKADIFNAATVSFIELRASIENDAAIAPENKDFEFAKLVAERIKKFNEVIFADEAALNEKKNERHAWHTQMREFANKLREDQRAKLKQFDITYTPSTPVAARSVRTSKPVGPGKGKKKNFTITELKAAAGKYNLPYAQVQSIVISRNMTPTDAAEHLANLMGLIPSTPAQ